MAAYDWIMGLAGLFAVFILFGVLTQCYGFTVGVLDTMWQTVNQTITLPQRFYQLYLDVNNTFTQIWPWTTFMIFLSFLIYIIISSMRRRPEDMYI